MFQYWDSELEKLAQDWANACHVSHRPNAGRKNVGKIAPGPFTYIGENLYAGTGG